MSRKPAEPRSSTEPDWRGILSRFSDARCILECAVRSLEQWRELDDDEEETDRRTDDVEVVCLRHAAKLLAEVYDELDRAIGTLARERDE
ncbi:MAG TPA: hypothetical protein VF161_03800 [Steroidobacteraceae bacterium]|jgi:hypothetical protein